MSKPHIDFGTEIAAEPKTPPTTTSQSLVRTGVASPVIAASTPRHGQADAPGAGAVFHSLRRKWMQMAVAGCVCGAAAGSVAWLLFQPKYHTSAALRIHSETPRLAFNLDESEGASQFDVFKRTQRELVLGDGVLIAALGDAKVTENASMNAITQGDDPVVWLRSQLGVEFPGNAEIMSISMQGDEPKMITELVNAVLDAYVDNVIEVGKQQRSERLTELRKALNAQEEKARRLRSKLQSLTEALGSGDTNALSIKQQVAIQRYAQLQSEHGKVRFDRLRSEIELARLTDELNEVKDAPAKLAAAAPAPRIELQVEADERVAKLREAAREATSLLNEAETRIGGGTKLANYQLKAEEAEKYLAEERKTVLAELQDRVSVENAQVESNRLFERQQEVERLKNHLETLTLHEQSLAESLQEATSAADSIGTSSVNVELTRNELTRLDAINDRIGVEIETLTIELSSASRIEQISRAREPQGRSDQERIKKAATFGMIGFIIPCLGLLWQDTRGKRITGVQELRQLSDIRVLGAVPLLSRRMRNGTGAERGNIAMQEAVDRIRTVLIREAELADYRVVQVTSAMPGEGKTTFACQLARSLARANRRTVLVDFDIRCPSVHEAFGIALSPGVCDALTGHTEIRAVARPSKEADLWLVAAGQSNLAAASALNRGGVDRLLSQLREEYEFVIVDTSPVLPVVDALLVGQRTDATVLTALRDVSQGPCVQEACDRLTEVGAHVIGAIVTTKGHRTYYNALDRYSAV